MTHRRFIYIVKRSSYEREWGKRLQEPNIFEKFLAFLLKIIPPVGPLQILQLKLPTPAVEQMFQASFDRTVAQYGGQLDAAAKNNLDLQDRNFDVGPVTPAGVYRLTDDTQAFWLNKLAVKGFVTATPEMKRDLLEFYKDLSAPIDTKRKPKQWRQTLAELSQLKGQAADVTSETSPDSGGSFCRSSQEPGRALSLGR